MATITPSVVNSPKETCTSKGGYLRLTITSISDSDATTNKRYIGCKLTIEGTAWVGLYKWECTLGGQNVSSETRSVENWSPGYILASKNLTFDNDSSGNLSLTAYIKHIFYKGSGSWNTSYAKSCTETLVCSQLPRYANFTSHSATSTLNTITVSYTADANYKAQQYSLDSGNWTDCTSDSYTLTGFTPGSTHTIKTKIQRTDSDLWTESDTITINLKNLPTSNDVSNTNFDSNGVNINSSISSVDFLSGWYIKVKDNTTTIIDGTSSQSTLTSNQWTTSSADAVSMLNRHSSDNNWTLDIEFYVVSNGVTYQLISKTCSCILPSGIYLPIYTDSNLSYEVLDSTSNNITGSNQKIIKGISNVRIHTTQASPQGGSSMSSYTATCGSKSGTSTSLSNTYIDLSSVDASSFSVQATDTRGRSISASKNYSTYIDYFSPYNTSINISRVDGIEPNVIINIAGKYMNWSNLSTTNTITQVSIQYKVSGSSVWTTLTGFNLSISASNGNFTASGTTTGDVFDISNEYTIKITLQDKLTQFSGERTIYTANVLLWKDLAHHRIGIGKKPSVELDVEGSIRGNLQQYHNGTDTITNTLGYGRIKALYNVSNGTANLFPVTNNANSIIQISRHNGNYDSQLGFSSNGNLYYKNCNNVTLDTKTWKRLLFYEELFDFIYPIGSIYISATPTNPSTIFGGTWQQLKNHFLFATNDTTGNKGKDSISTSNGFNTTDTTLTTDQIPAHTHGSKTLSGTTTIRDSNTADHNSIVDATGIFSFDNSEAWSGSHWGFSGSNFSNYKYNKLTVNATHEHDSVGGGNGHNHEVPYIEVYVWQRTA